MKELFLKKMKLWKDVIIQSDNDTKDWRRKWCINGIVERFRDKIAKILSDRMMEPLNNLMVKILNNWTMEILNC